MTEILMCKPAGSNHAMISDLVAKGSLYDAAGAPSSKMVPNRIYTSQPELTSKDREILKRLSSVQTARRLTDISHSIGGQNTSAAADVMAKLYDYNIGLLGASTTVYSNRIGGFAGSVKKYQDALLNYRDVMKLSPNQKIAARKQVQSTFKVMQQQFHNELKVSVARNVSSRGTVLSNSTRGINIANSSRNVSKLYVGNKIQAQNIVKFTKYAKGLGNGLAMIDFGGRVVNVAGSYQSGGNWERELFVESSSFAASATTGIVTVNIGLAALGFLMVATPIGWVGLIVAGAGVASVSAGTSMAVNSYFKNNSGQYYDDLMKVIAR